jgi:hypothetical protein
MISTCGKRSCQLFGFKKGTRKEKNYEKVDKYHCGWVEKCQNTKLSISFEVRNINFNGQVVLNIDMISENKLLNFPVGRGKESEEMVKN